MLRLKACGAFNAKLPTVGSNSLTTTVEPPSSLRNSCCLVTVALGKSKAGEIYFAVKKRIRNAIEAITNVITGFNLTLVDITQANTGGISVRIKKFRRIRIRIKLKKMTRMR